MVGNRLARPEVDGLRESIVALRREVARALADAEELSRVVAPQLSNRYQLQVGPWELLALQSEAEFRRAQKALELVRDAVAQGERLSAGQLNAGLQPELQRWAAQVAESLKRLDAARENEALGTLDVEGRSEAHALFVELVQRLHPELHPEDPSAQSRLWHRCQDAHARQDIQELRDLLAIVGEGTTWPPEDATATVLTQARERLQGSLDQLLGELERLRASPPLCLATLLDDPSWLEERRRDAVARRSQFEEARQELEFELAVLLELPPVDSAGPN